MPILELRDTLQGTALAGDDGRFWMTKRINLKEGKKNQILSIDVTNDNIEILLQPGGSPNPNAYQLFVSPYPAQYTDLPWGPNQDLPNSGPMAGDDTVLYKEAVITTSAALNTQNRLLKEQFPNPQVGATPTNYWYSDHLYITLMYWGEPGLEYDVKFSLFVRVKQASANATSHSMGSYAEFLDAQARLLTETAVMMNPLDVPGYTFPMWKYGGIRPELMISGTTALRYYNRVAANANQEMTTRAALETAFMDAKQAVDFNRAFGDPALNLPDWISLMDVAGVTAGPIRQYPPPLKYADNGNTLMF